MKHNITILVCTAFILFFKANAQTHAIDSLRQILPNARGDSSKIKVDILLLSGQRFARNLPDSAAYYFKQAGALSEKINYPVGTLKFIANYAELLNHQSRYNEALALNLRAIDISQKSHLPKRLAAAYCNTGASYYYMADYKTCADYFIKATSILENERLEKRSDKVDLAGLYANLTGIFSEIEQNDRAYMYGLKSIAMCRELKDSETLCRSLSNVGEVLSDLGKEDSAILCLNQARAIAVKTNNKISESSADVTMAGVYEKVGHYEQMLHSANNGLQLSRQLNDSDGISKCLLYNAIYHLNHKEYVVARTFARRGLSIARSNKLYNHIGDEYLILSDIELALGDLPEYHRLRSLSDSMKEEVLSQQILKSTRELEEKYSSAKKQMQIDSLSKEKHIQALKIKHRRQTNIWLAAALIVLSITGLLYYRNYQQKKKLLEADGVLQKEKISQLENEKQLMATQAVLQGQEEERSRLAKDLHDGLGGILSSAKYSLNSMKEDLIIPAESAAAFERTISIMDKSISELRRVAHNMMPESLIHQSLGDALNDLCNQLTTSTGLNIDYRGFGMDDDTLDNPTKITVYRIVQELLNNSIKHAQATSAIVQVIEKDKTLHITMEDNGKGFNIDLLKSVEGIGYKNIKSRIDYLKGKIDIQSQFQMGTSVYIEIPILL